MSLEAWSLAESGLVDAYACARKWASLFVGLWLRLAFLCLWLLLLLLLLMFLFFFSSPVCLCSSSVLSYAS
jgi:hypothetical protein